MKMNKAIACLPSLMAFTATVGLAQADPALIQLATVPVPPVQNLVMDSAGNVYGSSSSTVFELTGADHQTLFNVATGVATPSQLAIDPAGNIYAEARYGGPTRYGSIFELSGANHQTMTTLTTFSSTSPTGSEPFFGLQIDASGNLFGATQGASVFKLSGPVHQSISYGPAPGGGNSTDLGIDSAGNLLLATDGYGTYDAGVVGELDNNLTPPGTVLHSFNTQNEGFISDGGLTADRFGNVYGTLNYDGPHNGGGVFELSGLNHTTFTLLVSFGSGGDGYPEGSVILDANGNVWGTTYDGGTYGHGTIYELLGPDHQTLTTVYSYNGTADDSNLEGGLTPDAYGNLYGEAVGVSTGDIFELTNTGFAVPEPASLAMVGIPAALALLRRRSRKLA